MERIVDEENKVVFFEGKWPGVMAVPIIMNRDHPGYSHQVLSCADFYKLKEDPPS